MRQIKNRLLLFNFSTHELIMNTICLFISFLSGKMYAVSHGLIHEDIIIDYNEIVSYLKETGFSFSDLDGGHIEVIKMYSI